MQLLFVSFGNVHDI